MKHTAILLTVAALCLLAGIALAQSGGGSGDGLDDGYDLTWNTIDGGGYTWSEGGGYSLGGTVGQPDAGVLSGGGYTLSGGFWAGGMVRYGIYLPLVMRNY